MTLIAEKEGQEVAKIQGPNRGDYLLEYHDPETGHVIRVHRNNLHVLRGITERLFPGMVWKE
jgi:hypothetical protein